MGFHIVNLENNRIQHDYVETYEELSYVDFITSDTIIYQGEEHWKPCRVGDSKNYKNFAIGKFRAGIQAQELFKEQATNNGYILEMLSQDQKSFRSYTTNSNHISIKRGDFLVRNFGNIEIDVKCLSFKESKGVTSFNFTYEHAIKHQNMQKFTNTPILIAVYENLNNKPVEDTVYLFSIDKLMESETVPRFKQKGKYDYYKIPLDFTEKGFSLINETYKKLNPSIHDFIKIQRCSFKNAYSKWSCQDDEKLEQLFSKGYSINQLSEEFGRNNGAIRARINKLELKEKHDD